jgi:predicted TIM-barrel fold metal-dependent hydrolase
MVRMRMRMRCDSHVHIVGPAARYRQVPGRTYTAGVAGVETLQGLGARRGIGRFVVVQPSFYGTDNSATLDALDALGGNGRGVAVVDPAVVSAETLAAYDRRGVRGLRLNLYSPISTRSGGTPGQAFAATADVARRVGWHVQVVAALPVLLAAADALARAPAAVVIDHYGLYGDKRPDSVEGRRLLDLVRLPHVWMKLSAPYRHDRGPLNTRPDREWLAALLEAAPHRCVWGSDWPHPPAHDTHQGAAVETPYRVLSYEALVDDFIAALPSPDLAERVMSGNAARLYGFQALDSGVNAADNCSGRT